MDEYRKGVHGNMTDNQQKANKYLMRIRNADKDMRIMYEQILYLRYKASGMGAIRYDKDHVQTSPEDMVCAAIAEAVTLENKLFGRNKQTKEALERTQEILSIWGDKYATAIETYYLNHGSMLDVARNCKCSDRNAYRVKLEALERFSQYIV